MSKKTTIQAVAAAQKAGSAKARRTSPAGSMADAERALATPLGKADAAASAKSKKQRLDDEFMESHGMPVTPPPPPSDETK